MNLCAIKNVNSVPKKAFLVSSVSSIISFLDPKEVQGPQLP